ncbi:hypothetical protein [Helicobacter pylori]|uniref:hypothetical protein n=1 Tax=Helicobacter pylori TaxID=210 RepID=UPI0018E27C6E|nr:hypothetical protein [Helicobacter pylori]
MGPNRGLFWKKKDVFFSVATFLGLLVYGFLREMSGMKGTEKANCGVKEKQ